MANTADALDSLDDDWLIANGDAGGSAYSATHPGDVESWLAPRTGRDDRNTPNPPNLAPYSWPSPGDDLYNRYSGRVIDPVSMRPSPHSSGPFDAYAMLRYIDPRSDNAQGFDDAAGASTPWARGQTLTKGMRLAQGPYSLTMQGDGNFVLYNGKSPIWASDTAGRGEKAVFQGDGNLVVYGPGNRAVWASGTNGHPSASLLLQDDGNLVVYEGSRAIWATGTDGGKDVRGKSGGILGALGSVAKTVGSVVEGVARPVGGLITSPAHLISDIAQGKNLLSAVKDTVKRDLGNVGSVAPYAQAVLSVVPGVGAGVNAAIAAGSALAHGQNITDALVQGVKNMVPGGPLAQQALDTAYRLAKGQNVTSALADAARNQLPPGPARAAFDTGLALAHGANLQKTLAGQGQALASSLVGDNALAQRAIDVAGRAASGENLLAAATSAARDQAMNIVGGRIQALSPVATQALNGLGPTIGKALAQGPSSLVPPEVVLAAKSILRDPSLRQLPIEALSRKLGVPVMTARSAVASLVDTVSRAGGPSIPHLSPASHIAEAMPANMSFDQAMARFASRAAGPQFSHNARRAIQWTRGPAGYVSRTTEARGLDSTGTVYVVDPGDSMSKIATKVVGSAARWPELKAANPQIKDANAIQIGQRLTLPASWLKVVQTAPSVQPVGPAVVVSAPVATGNAKSPVGSVSTTHATIKQGSTGPDVMLWQTIIGVTADGKFGPGTAAATKTWQASKGLTADGIVGPQSWSKALSLPGITVASVPTGSTSTVVTYVVKSGDSPFKIAQAFTGNGSRFTELANANPSKKANILAGKLQVGEILSIPPTWGAAPNASPTMVAPADVPQIISQLPTVLPQVLAQLPQLASLPTSTTTTIAENPAAQPSLTQSPVPGIIPAVFSPNTTSTTMTPEGPVTQRTDPSGTVVSVSQPPITEASIAPTGGGSKALLIGAAIFGGILLLGKGSSSKLI